MATMPVMLLNEQHSIVLAERPVAGAGAFLMETALGLQVDGALAPLMVVSPLTLPEGSVASRPHGSSLPPRPSVPSERGAT